MAARSSSAPEPGFRGPTVIKLVGITYRQLDYWARTGLVTPSVRAADGSGTQRLYSFTDVVELRIIKRLLNAGVSLRQIRDAIGYLRRESGGKPLSDVTLISDGNRIYACHSGEEVVDVLSHGQAVFGIAVGRVWADTEGDLAHLPGEEPAAGRAPQPPAVAEPAAGVPGDAVESVVEATTGAPGGARQSVTEPAGGLAGGARESVVEAAGGLSSRAAPPGNQG
jgi:DNA-binding transcriptional MerR regulator